MTTVLHNETSALANADLMIGLCRDTYERLGFMQAAKLLRGMEVNCRSSAEVALLLVYELPQVKGAADVRDCTIAALHAAMN